MACLLGVRNHYTNGGSSFFSWFPNLKLLLLPYFITCHGVFPLPTSPRAVFIAIAKEYWVLEIHDMMVHVIHSPCEVYNYRVYELSVE